MDLRTFDSQADAFESSSRPESYRLFTYYHPQYQPECPVHQDDQYASFIFGDRECLGESAYYASSVSKLCFASGSFLDPLVIAMLIGQLDEPPLPLRLKWWIYDLEHHRVS